MKILTAILAGLVLLAGCNHTNKPANVTEVEMPVGTALVRFVDAAPGGANVDLWFGGAKLFSNANYKDVTPYAEVPAQRHDFKLQSANDAMPGVSDSEDLSAGAHYTVVAAPSRSGKIKIDVVRDHLSTPPAGKAKVRVINAAAGDETLAFIDSSGELFSGVNANSSTSYKDVRPGTETVEIRRGAKRADALRIPGFHMEPGGLYTIVIMGGGGQPLQAVAVVDQQASPAAGD